MNDLETSILIIEDDLEVLSILKSVFSKHFASIHTALNGKIASQLMNKIQPDLILTDIHMPEMGGIDFIMKLRAEGKNTPIIIVSSSRDREHLIKALKLGVHDFVEKPFKRLELEMAVYRVLEMSVRNNNLPDLIKKHGSDSQEVLQQKKLIGLLQAISAKNEQD